MTNGHTDILAVREDLIRVLLRADAPYLTDADVEHHIGLADDSVHYRQFGRLADAILASDVLRQIKHDVWMAGYDRAIDDANEHRRGDSVSPYSAAKAV